MAFWSWARSSAHWTSAWGGEWPWLPPTIFYTVTVGASLRLTSDTPRPMWQPKRIGKKTPRRPRRNQPAVARRRSDPANVPGRGAFRPHLRYPTLLVSEAGSPALPSYGHAGIHLHLW